MTTYAPKHIIPLTHRIAKPARTSHTRKSSSNTMDPVILSVGALLVKMVTQIGFIVLWFTQFGLSVNVRYGRYIVTFDDMPVFGLDLSFTLSGSPIFVNSPFGWESK